MEKVFGRSCFVTLLCIIQQPTSQTSSRDQLYWGSSLFTVNIKILPTNRTHYNPRMALDLNPCVPQHMSKSGVCRRQQSHVSSFAQFFNGDVITPVDQRSKDPMLSTFHTQGGLQCINPGQKKFSQFRIYRYTYFIFFTFLIILKSPWLKGHHKGRCPFQHQLTSPGFSINSLPKHELRVSCSQPVKP